MKRLLALGFASGASLLPAVAHACAACAANGKGQSNFLWPTIVMSLLPLGLIAGGIWWWRQRAGADLRAEWAERDDAVLGPAPITPPGAPPRPTAG